MAGRPKYKPADVIEALEKSERTEGSQHGIITRTARQLNCTRQTIHNYLNRYPKVWKTYMRVRYNYGISWGPKTQKRYIDLFN